VKLTITCGSFTNNTGDGLDLNVSGVGTITLKGVVSSGNGGLDINTYGNTPVTARTC
jgi:hypothetical protein